MKQMLLIFFVTMVCSLIAGQGFAKETTGALVADSQINLANDSVHKAECTDKKIQISSFETANPELPYLLQKNQQACLDRCTEEFNSCISGAGDSADKKFRCGESRWMCTRGCDNQFAPKNNSL
jgi:hypothetical protein